MDYKQKYEEALERARDLHDKHPLGQPQTWTTCEKIFPELKDSEDERMRNAAINACKYMVDNFENSTKQYEEAIAWLEKQGEQRSWSEEDDSRICQIIDWLSICKTYNPDQKSVCDISMQIAWLKSIKPNHWKPSQKQMEALCRAAFQCGNSDLSPYSDKDKELVSLYNNLKKL